MQIFSQWYECGKKCVLMIENSLFVFHCPHYIKAILMPVCALSDISLSLWKQAGSGKHVTWNSLWAGCIQKHLLWDLFCFFQHATHLILDTWIYYLFGLFSWIGLCDELLTRPRLYPASHPNTAPTPSLHGRSGLKRKMIYSVNDRVCKTWCDVFDIMCSACGN